MGSGCVQNISFNCPDPVSDQCVIYTGEPIPWLGICTGDRLSEIEEAILNKLLEFSKGQGIHLNDIVANCPFLEDFLAQSDKSLYSLIQGLLDNQCTLNQVIEDVKNGIEPPFPFDTKCLQVPANPNRNQILQATINKTCAIEEKVDNLLDQVAELGGDDDDGGSLPDIIEDIVGNALLNNISSCQNVIERTGAGKDAKINLVGLPPPGTILYGWYSVSDFDNTGKGLPEKGMCGWNIANGWNNTVDMRGWTPAGATNIPGPALLSQVRDNGDTDLVTNQLQRKGRYKITLASNQLPDHEHLVEQTPHTHPYSDEHVDFTTRYQRGTVAPVNNTWRDSRVNSAKTTGGSTVNLEVKGIKGAKGQPIDNRQPTVYLMFIMRPKPGLPPVITL